MRNIIFYIYYNYYLLLSLLLLLLLLKNELFHLMTFFWSRAAL